MSTLESSDVIKSYIFFCEVFTKLSDASDNVRNNINVPKETYQTRISNGSTYILSSNKIMKYNQSNWASITQPIQDIVGFNVIDKYIVCYNEESILLYDCNSNELMSKTSIESPVKSFLKIIILTILFVRKVIYFLS